MTAMAGWSTFSIGSALLPEDLSLSLKKHDKAKNIAFSPDNFNSKIFPLIKATRLFPVMSGTAGLIFFSQPIDYGIIHWQQT